MKAIIVDDERPVRNLLRMAIDWEALGVRNCLEAADGEEAMRLIEQERPELIITDMNMPKQDGVFLLHALAALDYPHRTLVVSGYDDFHYMKKTIEYGGFDYFIKPIDEEDIFERLKAAIAEIRQEKKDAEANTRAVSILTGGGHSYRDHLLTQWLDRTGSADETNRGFKSELGIEEGMTLAIVLVRTDERHPRLRRLFADRRDLLNYAIVNIANEILSSPELGIAFRYLSNEGEVVLLVREVERIHSLCARISEAIRRVYRYQPEFCVGDAFVYPESPIPSIRSAENVYWNKNYLAASASMVFDQRQTVSSKLIYLLDDEQELKLMLSGMNQQAIESFVGTILDRIRTEGAIRMKQIELWEQELQWLQEYYLERTDPVTVGIFDEGGRFSLHVLGESLKSHLAGLIEEIGNSMKVDHNETVYQVRDYIRSAYHKPIQIKDLSERFYLNPEYLTRQFKKSFGITIKDFLTELRIENAKLLLSNPHLKLADIADMVGYQDEKYFSKVFKKLLSCTPQQYRKSLEKA